MKTFKFGVLAAQWQILMLSLHFLGQLCLLYDFAIWCFESIRKKSFRQKPCHFHIGSHDWEFLRKEYGRDEKDDTAKPAFSPARRQGHQRKGAAH